jgi:hypothetical protein
LATFFNEFFLDNYMIRRFSSRRQPIDQTFLNDRLKGAQSYDRIAGYFSSSILEVAGEALESITGRIRMVCNSDLGADDVKTARAANYAIRREWCGSEPEKLRPAAQPRLKKLHDFLKSEKLVVRVLPSETFGLVHGKAGVITMGDGRRTAFMGSINETYAAWRLNYELVWEDDSDEAVAWVQEEFEALWNHPAAQNLADFVIDDVERLSRRIVLPGVKEWRDDPEAAAPIVESPVYRKEFGLWAHQKYFVKIAFDAHQSVHGARFVLADQVGLGKTLQLGMAAQLMALWGDKPVLIIVPKTLVWQWQDELHTMLDMPSAVWTGKAWVDEYGIEHPVAGPQGILKCPRRAGIVSQGLITRGSEVVDHLKDLRYECVIVDEAHRIRRRNLGPGKEAESADSNNLMQFVLEIASRTKSMMLATATPVQLHPLEAWDLLNVLSVGTEHVFGNTWSHWRKAPEAIEAVIHQSRLPEDAYQAWGWIRNPLPFSFESREFEMTRRSLGVSDDVAVVPGDAWDKLRPPDQARLQSMAGGYVAAYNPFIRQIIRRTRDYLETTINPETNEPFLKPVRVELLGEADDEAIVLPPYLRDAYLEAEEFCNLLGHRVMGSGFMKTLLLRRVGSTIFAGRLTATKILETWESIPEVEEEEDAPDYSEFRSITPVEREHLQRFVSALDANQERDPKYQVVVDCLKTRGWLEEGCIVFSQYFDSITWLSEQLTVDFPEERMGVYGGGQRSGIMCAGEFESTDRESIKRMVAKGELRLLLGTDAADWSNGRAEFNASVKFAIPSWFTT